MLEEVQHQAGTLVGGRYRLEKPIAQGGMGTVWSARDESSQRLVAIKLLNEEAARDPIAAQRLYNEANAANAADHAGIVEVLELGQTEEGVPYLVMELLEGQSLADLLEASGGRLKPLLAIDIIAQTLAALAAAHEKGIIHRDLKPQNIYLCPSAHGGPRVKVLDFGISKIWGDGKPLHLTQTGHVVGTPYYMSPEHARGAKDINAQTDIWAVGVVLYELLLGRVPFDGENYNEIISRILSEPVVPPRRHEPRLTRPLEKIMMQALSKERERRYDSALAFRNDLLELDTLVEEPTESFRTQLEETLSADGQGLDSRKLIIAAVVLLTLFLGSATGVFIITQRTLGGSSSSDTRRGANASTAPTQPPPTPLPPPAQQPPIQPSDSSPVADAGPELAAPPVPVVDAGTTDDADTSDRDDEELALVRFNVSPETARPRIFINGERIDGEEANVRRDERLEIAVYAPGYRSRQFRRIITSDTVVDVELTPAPSRSSAHEGPRRDSTNREQPDDSGGSRITIVEDYPQK